MCSSIFHFFKQERSEGKLRVHRNGTYKRRINRLKITIKLKLFSAMSSVWDYATKRKNPTTKQQEAQCGRCNKVIKCSGGSSTSLKSHLKQVHSIDVEKCAQTSASSENSTSEKKSKTIEVFLQRQSLKPTSTDVERVFSVCTNFCTKIRSRLSDKSLQALVFLKYYYQK